MIKLRQATGIEDIDRVIRHTIECLESRFPGYIHGYYLLGSRACGTSLPTSDIDLAYVSEVFSDEQQLEVHRIFTACGSTTTVDLGSFSLSGSSLQGLFNPMFKLQSLFLYGQDIRGTIPLVPISLWAKQCMHAIYRVMGHHGRFSSIVYPIGFPDANGEFFGYDRSTVHLPDGSKMSSVRSLVTDAGWMATALIAYQARRYVLGKNDFPRFYRKYINDGWSVLLDSIYSKGHDAWNYHVPNSLPERKILKHLCRSYLGFENHFLSVYRNFAIQELHGTEEEAMHALLALEHLPYHDLELESAILELQRGNERLRHASCSTLCAYDASRR